MTTLADSPGSAAEDAGAPLLHDAAEVYRRLNGAVSEAWLRRKAGQGLIPCTRIGRRPFWSDADIAQLIAENYCDPHDYGRKPKRSA